MKEPMPRRGSDGTTLRSDGVQHVSQGTGVGDFPLSATITTPSTKTRSQGI